MTTLPSIAVAHARDEPERVALLDAEGNRWTRAELVLRATAWANVLAAAGVDAGQRVAVSCTPRLETVAAYLGVLRAGAVVVPANTGYTEREILHIVTDARPAVAIVDDPERATRWHGAGVSVIDASQPVMDTHRRPSGRVLDAAKPSDPALIGYTSGTTGNPKGAVLTHANLLAGARSVVRAWDWTSDDRLVLALPLFHMHGLGVGINGTLVSGGSAIVLPSFSPDEVFDAVAQHDASMFFGVPTMYSRLARSSRVSELSRLRVAVSGSAPLPPAVWERVHSTSGVQILERYGMTETVMLASNPLQGVRRAGTVGLPLPGVEIRLGPGDVVEVRGDNVFHGYLERPDATADAFTTDGWFRTGDIGVFDDEGYLSLIGRASELIITGGYNVYPREVEEVLRRNPLVSDVAIVGTPDDEWGETVTAYVVLTDSGAATKEWWSTLADHARRDLAAYKVPRHWFRLDALPRNAMGKVLRHELAPPSP